MALKPKARKESKKTEDIKFFAISLKKLYLLSVVTFGIYDIYWTYRNWKAVRDDTGQKLSPFWRAIFTVFFIWGLFRKISDSAKTHGYKMRADPTGLAAVYVILLLIGNGIGRMETFNLMLSIVAVVTVFLSALVLLPIQKAINFNADHIKGGRDIKKNSWGEVTIIVVGIIIAFFATLGYFLPPEAPLSPEAQAEKTKLDSLTAQYETCSTDLMGREKTLDQTSQAAVDSYNADWQTCEDIRLDQNKSVDRYNSLISH